MLTGKGIGDDRYFTNKEVWLNIEWLILPTSLKIAESKT